MKGFEQYDFFSTKDFEAIKDNARIVVSVLFIMIGGLDFLLLFQPSSFYGVTMVAVGLLSSVLSYLLWRRSCIRHLVKRDIVGIIEWTLSFVLLVIALCPISFHVFMGLDWTMFEKYGWGTLAIYWQFEYVLLPMSILVVVCLFYWISTIQFYKKSYLAHLSFIKKKEIYGE